jgi:hypothetical protein
MSKNVEFITRFVEILGGDNFLLCDQINQEDLFEMQDAIAHLIADNANEGLGLAKHIASLCPTSFQTSKM